MTNLLRALCALGLSSSLSLSLVACSNDDQSLGSNDLASTSGGSGGSAGTGSQTNGGGSAGSPTAGGSAGAPAVDPATRRICDGSDGITLGHTHRGGGQIESIDAVIFEAGFGSFYVDGHCNFWIINAGPDSRWAPARTGTLTTAEEAQLAADFAYASWGGLVPTESYCGGPGEDQGATTVFDRSTAFSCAGDYKATTPAAVKAVFTNANAWEEKLLAQGTPLSGPIRLRSIRSEALGWKTRPLTLSFSLADVAIQPDDYHFGDAPLITGAADLATLRDLRATLLADTSSIASQFEVVGNDALRYRINFRDALPIEDEHGLVPIPGVPSGH